MPLDFVIDSTGGCLAPGVPPPAEVSGVSIDTRRLKAGELFVALPGTRSDGHAHLADAAGRGAGAAVVERLDGDHGGLPLVQVADCATALAAMGAAWRRRFDLKVAAVTGSNGKTTVKGMILSVMRAELGADAVCGTEGNLNNHLGVPLTLLGIGPHHLCAVVEMGMSGPGEIASLCSMAAPSVAIVNNAQRGHVGSVVGGLEGVACCKGEIVQGVSSDGAVVLNMDDPFFGMWSDMAAGRRILGFSASRTDAFARLEAKGGRTLIAVGDLQPFEVELKVWGQHNRMNALAACCAGYALGASGEAIAKGLSSFEGVPRRMQVLRGAGGMTVIDDTYNANPDSAIAAVRALAERPERRKLLVLGDMLELGAEAEALHAEVGRAAAGLDGLFTVGEFSRAASAECGGMHFADKPSLAEHVVSLASSDTVALVKGSRGAAMEDVADVLAARDEG